MSGMFDHYRSVNVKKVYKSLKITEINSEFNRYRNIQRKTIILIATNRQNNFNKYFNMHKTKLVF